MQPKILRQIVSSKVHVWISLFLACWMWTGCVTAEAADTVSYARDIKPLLERKCFSCHGVLKQEADLRLDTVSLMQAGGDSGAAISAGDADSSLLLARVRATDADERMPPDGEPLTAQQIEQLRRWIDDGAKAPANEQPQSDPRTHWAFQPLKPVRVPDSKFESPVDAFISRRLRASGLDIADPADAVTLLRRLYLDLHGLPPLPDAIAAFRENAKRRPSVAYAAAIDGLLASPRYGERWAQHWLDVVRYADTHGFEVNTPRENAWPYRDYVIRAFNEDKPYDRFVFEQLAGDLVGEDAATGFMVAAPVLLPGQIGKDEASKRLARQDALDEIIVGTTATFLGLTVGCARCHDHKFDPITQDEYYAMQAFFAGVQYGDRPLRGPAYESRLTEAAEIAPRIERLKSQLRAFQPHAFTGRTVIVDDEDIDRVSLLKKKNGHGVNPAGTQQGYRDDVGSADRSANISRGRYSWWDNEPGEDIFTWNPGAEGRFRLWISWGVHGSGVHTRDARYVLDRDGDLTTDADQLEVARADQYYFAGQTAGTSEKKPRWSGLMNAGTYDWRSESKLVLRGGDSGSGITADVIVLQEEMAGESECHQPCLRGPISPAKNIERFEPVSAKYIRLAIFATIDDNRHEPCIDELEIYSAEDEPRNVGLATLGAKATSSGNYSETGKHQLRHINDGRYGNSHSWISNQRGGGWVKVELPEVTKIREIIWSRDRDGKFNDRLPVRYSIDVSTDGQRWSTVASSADRVAMGTPFDDVKAAMQRGSTEGAGAIAKLSAELQQLEKRSEELQQTSMVYAGIFREPDVTRVLSRGDPEQPEDRIGPGTPKSIGAISLDVDAEESERRRALANWIISADNPLTARVMVNRIWQYHFGRGLVETPSDFGLNGARPTHPDLLDYLAAELIHNNWSVKHIHRMILMSQTFRQTSRVDSKAYEIDADCKLLWRFPSRRLEAEAIRDSILAISGNLNLQTGGPGFSFFKTRGGLSGFPPIERFTANELRRMIYAHKIRMEPVPVFGAFDCPDAGQPMPTRSQSTTAIQALNLFNSPFVIDQANSLADRVIGEVGSDPQRQVDRAFLWVVGRKPTEAEAQASVTAVRKFGLATLCRVLFNSNEFLFIP